MVQVPSLLRTILGIDDYCDCGYGSLTLLDLSMLVPFGIAKIDF